MDVWESGSVAYGIQTNDIKPASFCQYLQLSRKSIIILVAKCISPATGKSSWTT